MYAGAAREPQPGAPFSRFKQSRHGMTETVVVRDRKIREGAGGQAWQRSSSGKNYPDTDSIFLSQKLRAEEGDLIRLLEGVGADYEGVVRCRRRFTAHFRFAEQGVARLPASLENRFGFTEGFLPRTDPTEFDL